MRSLLIIGTLLLAGCGGEAAPKKEAEAVPAKLPAGQYEVTATVKSLASTDKTPVPTFAKVGDTIKSVGCVSEDGLPAAELLAAKGDSCQLTNPYVRSGRMNFQLDCNRKGQGKVMSNVSGSYTADGFTGTLTATSYFSGPGDYRLVEEVTARKVADQCTATAGGEAAPKKA